MDMINFDSAAKELPAQESNATIFELADLQLALVGGGIGDTQL